ncbi:MAG: putative lipid II flippase FtsW [Deltaproteobacteria bacterium]|nr:putative lipid II flippase FtsW [Deltaproteobacteria bacterium]MBW2071629.1 putative lipid II flippase FtsW [Deltaproteobacteria bacterium]
MDRIKKLKSSYDLTLLCTTLALVVWGLVMLYSASSILAQQRFGDSLFFVKRQIIFALVGLALLIGSKNIPYKLYHRLVYLILAVCLLSLALVLLPQIGHRVGGARRWLRLGPISLQPAEFAKLSLIMYLSYSLAKKEDRLKDFSIGYVPHVMVTGLFVGLIILEPDLGTAITYALLAFLLLFVAGVRFRYLILTAVALLPMLFLAISGSRYRWERLLAFLDPWRDPSDTSFQLLHSLLALGSGGLLGVGLGAGKQKLFYLPEPHTDFILAVLGEEMGLLGIAGVLLLYGLLLWKGVHIALRAPDRYASYLAFGLTLLIGVQVMINGAVVMGLLPTKGLPLPLMSYGGSSLLTNLVAIGILLNIASSSNKQATAKRKDSK